MYYRCGPQRITCVYCKKEFGADVFLDADIKRYYDATYDITLVCCPRCDHLQYNIYDIDANKSYVVKLENFKESISKLCLKLLNLFLKIIHRKQK